MTLVLLASPSSHSPAPCWWTCGLAATYDFHTLPDERAPSVPTPAVPPFPPPRIGPRRGAHFWLFVPSGICFVLTVVLVVVIGAAASMQDTDSERQAIGFFLTAAILPCGASVLLLFLGFVFLMSNRGQRR